MSWFDDIGDWFSSSDAPSIDAVAEAVPDVSNYAGDSVADLLSSYGATGGNSELPSWLQYTPSSFDSAFNTANSADMAQSLAPSVQSLMGSSDNANWGIPSFDPSALDQAAQANTPGIMDTLDSYAKMLDSPGAKLLASLGGAGIAAYGANKQNALAKKAAEEQAAALAARQAAANQYSSPLRLAYNRTAVAPVARGGESLFFTNNKLPSYFAQGGNVSSHIGLARGGDSGQSDKVPAMFSPGEYVMDADTVASLGDGNNEAGARQLDGMREAIRAHKRSAPTSAIPPKAKSPLAYMKPRRAK